MKKSILASILSVASIVSVAFVAHAQVTTPITCPPGALFNAQTGQHCPTASGSPTTCLTLTRNLSIGSRDTATLKDVTNLQKFLISQKLLNTTPTGYFGSLTFAAVKAFQKKYGISQVGSVGPITKAQIKLISCQLGSGGGTPPPIATSTLPAAVVVTGSGSSLSFTSVSSFSPSNNGGGGGGGNNPTPGPTVYTITASASANGSISPGGTVSVQKNQDQTFTITPSAGYQISDVQVDGASVGAATSYTFPKVQANHTISVSYVTIPTQPTVYSITASAGSGGSISPTGQTSVTSGQNQTYTITPNSGFQISSVLVDSSSVGSPNSYQFTNVTGNHTISATFTSIPVPTYSVIASAGSNGSISPSGTNTINQGTAATYTFTPNSGFQVASITVDGVSQPIASSYTFPSTTTGSHTISVTFSAIPPVQYTVTATAGSNGSISPSGTVTTNQGTSRTFTITPASGFQISSVTVDGVSQGAVSTYTFPGTTSGSHTISAAFVAIPPTIFTITASAGSNGTISPSGAVSVTSGNTQNFTVTPNSGYQISSVVIDGVSQTISSTYSFTNVSGNHTISATFSLIPPPATFTVTASAGTNGSVSPTTQTVNSGSSASITITPNSGFQIASITLDGIAQTIASPFTVSNVTANHAVNVTFSQTVTPPPGTGTTYYVSVNSGNDANTGKSDALAFKTLQKAANAVVPGDTVIVRAGTYTTGFELPFKQGATQRISFLADPGVTITGPSNGVSGNVGIAIAIGYNFPNAVSASMEPVTIQGFNIDGSNGSISSFGIYVMWADGTIIQNNTAMHTGSTGIFSKYTSNILIQNNTAAFDGKVEGQHGVYVADSNSHATIRGNLLYNNFDSGIHMNGDAASGLYPQAGDHTGDINFALIEDNIIHDNGLNGMNLDGLRNSVVRNNLLYQNGQALGHKDITIFTSDSADSPMGNAIYNNTITSTISNGTTHHNINMDSGTGSNNNNAVFNNVVYQVWPPNGDAPILIDSTVSNGTSVGHNAATTEAAGSTDVAIPNDNPANIFANFAGNDFHLKSGSVVIDKGVASFGGFSANAVVNGFPATDLDGNTRPAGAAFDIGAYEFNGTQAPTFTITVSAGANGTISPSGSVSVNSGGTQSFTITPNSGFQIGTLTVDGVSVTPQTTYTFSNVTANHTITATFSQQSVGTFTIAASAGAGGSITPSGSVSVNSGASQTFTITPNAGFQISSVTLDGVSQGTNSTLTIPNVTANHTVTASFSSTSGGTSYTVWSPSAVPASADSQDSNTVEIGMKFRANTAGTVTGVRFYKSAANTGTHIGSLWTNSGTLLGQVTFSGETASGWQQANFASPISIAANTTYIVSYHAPVGRYSGDNNYFATNGVTNGPLTALANGVDGGNGVFVYGTTPAFPANTYKSSNYWVDVVFSPSQVGTLASPQVYSTASALSGLQSLLAQPNILPSTASYLQSLINDLVGN